MRFVDLSKSLPQQASNEEFFLQFKHFLVRNFVEKIQFIKNSSHLVRVVSVSSFFGMGRRFRRGWFQKHSLAAKFRVTISWLRHVSWSRITAINKWWVWPRFLMQIRDFQNKIFILCSPGFNLSCGGFADNFWTDSYVSALGTQYFTPKSLFCDFQFCEKENAWFEGKKQSLLDTWYRFELHLIIICSWSKMDWETVEYSVLLPNVSKADELFQVETFCFCVRGFNITQNSRRLLHWKCFCAYKTWNILYFWRQGRKENIWITINWVGYRLK